MALHPSRKRNTAIYYVTWPKVCGVVTTVRNLCRVTFLRLLVGSLLVVGAPSNEKDTRCESLCDTATTVPLKVFLLVGQSNMQGHGYIDRKDEQTGLPLNGTLEWMIQQEKYKDVKLKDPQTGEWIQRKDVWITYNKQQHVNDTDPVVNVHGELTMGPYGGDPGDTMQMGPELGFGWALGDVLEDQVLLLKVAWGGKSLAVDFRPPSSGGQVGPYYQVLLRDIQTTLHNLTSLFPPSCSCQTYDYEITGLGWHQGWNDACDVNMTNEYESNLANFIRDIRADLKTPQLPIVIGATGMCGYKNNVSQDCSWNVKANTLVHAQFEVSTNAEKNPDFADGSVFTVETRHFARKPPPISPGDQIYHWMNNCESYWLIGQAMGKAMLEIILNLGGGGVRTSTTNLLATK